MEKNKESVKVIKNYSGGQVGGAFYGLGFVGALVYYIQQSQTFLDGIVGVLKAIIWPALLIHRVLTLLEM